MSLSWRLIIKPKKNFRASRGWSAPLQSLPPLFRRSRYGPAVSLLELRIPYNCILCPTLLAYAILKVCVHHLTSAATPIEANGLYKQGWRLCGACATAFLSSYIILHFLHTSKSKERCSRRVRFQDLRFLLVLSSLALFALTDQVRLYYHLICCDKQGQILRIYRNEVRGHARYRYATRDLSPSFVRLDDIKALQPIQKKLEYTYESVGSVYGQQR